MRRRKISTEERAYIDMIPLVDTLLAVFLFLAILAFQSPMTLLAVKLPFAEHGQKDVQAPLRVQVAEDGSYRIEGQLKSLEDIEKTISDRRVKAIVLEADENVKHKYVVALMDIAKKHGVEDVVVATRNRP